MSNERSNQSYMLIAHRGLPQDYPENTLIGPTRVSITH